MFSCVGLLIMMAVTLYVALLYTNYAMVLLVYMQGALFVFAIITFIYRRRTIRTRLEVPVGIAESGKENLVKISINNTGIAAVTRAKANITVTDTTAMRRSKYSIKMSELIKGNHSYIRNLVLNKPGNYQIMLKSLRVYDITGMMYWDIKIGSMVELQVIPPMHNVQVRLTNRTMNFYGEADVYDENRPGYDVSEILKIREYAAGDSLKNVHWKLTAKQDDLMVKEQSLPKACPVVLFLDYGDTGKRQDASAYIEAAISISFSVMDAGCSHYVVWYDRNEMDIVRMRVDDEESLFCFLSNIMKVIWEAGSDNIVERYADKYRGEAYACRIVLNHRMVITRDDREVGRLDANGLEESLSQVELVL